nr:hypothetical protein [Bilophila wadsworthia]
MTLTASDIAHIRAVAEADKAGEDGKAWDEAITPDIVIALCDRIKRLEKEANYLAEGYTTAVDLFHECPLGNNLCRKVSCMECMRESARKAVEEARTFKKEQAHLSRAGVDGRAAEGAGVVLVSPQA